jgi:hypothetical protein
MIAAPVAKKCFSGLLRFRPRSGVLLLLGETKQALAAGIVAYVPWNTKHQLECTSDELLECVYFASWR